VEVEFGAGEEESAREEVYGQRVDCEDRDEQNRPAKEPGAAAVVRRRRHHLRFRSGAARRGCWRPRWATRRDDDGPILANATISLMEVGVNTTVQ
jgi:hypothetical protein